MLKPKDFNTLSTHDMGIIPTENTQPGLDRNEEYILYVKLGVNFWANRAQLVEARKYAEKELLNTLYADILGITNALRSAIFAGDAKQALSYIDQMHNKLGV